jgi:hypothetical protein
MLLDPAVWLASFMQLTNMALDFRIYVEKSTKLYRKRCASNLACMYYNVKVMSGK